MLNHLFLEELLKDIPPQFSPQLTMVFESIFGCKLPLNRFDFHYKDIFLPRDTMHIQDGIYYSGQNYYLLFADIFELHLQQNWKMYEGVYILFSFLEMSSVICRTLLE